MRTPALLASIFIACFPFRILAADPAPEIGEVVVTGSRIPANVLTPLVPVTVLERADIERGNPGSIAQVLQALPFNTGSPLNSNVNNGGDGSARVDLRGLGPQRTLVLLNGRRLPNGGIGADSSADLNSIPVSMIDRVEVLTSDATAVYGADAVAGVINVITRNSFHGFELSGSRALTSKSDGGVTHVQALAGNRVRENAEVVLGADYLEQAGVTLDQREYSSVPLHILDASGVPQYLGGRATPYGPFDVPDGNVLGLEEGRYAVIPGTTGQAATDFGPFGLAETFNYQPYNYSQTPSKRSSVWLQGSLPLSGATTAFVEGLGNLRKSSQQLAPTPYDSGFDGAPQLEDGSFGIPADNFYNPFGVDLPMARRRFVEINDRGFSEDVRLWRVVAGVRGELRSWHWEFSAGYSSSTAVTHENGLISFARLFPAIGPSGPDTSGNIVCGAPDGSGIVPSENIIADCTPVNLFGGPGTVTQDQVAQLEVPLRDQGRNSQRRAELNASGTWGSISGEPISWAVGAAYRREAGHYRFDPQRAAGIVGLPLQADVPGGEFDTRDVYGEMRATVLHDLPAVRQLELSAGTRYADSSNFGGHSVWQSGVRWQPAALVSLRASYATGFRAPSIAELYQAQVASLSDITPDPCGHNPSPGQRANCAANGVPGGSYVQDPTAGFHTLAGGNPQLGPERTRSFNAGLDVHWGGPAAGRASVGFFRTSLSGFISPAAVDTLLEECANTGLTAACSHIERHPDGSLERVIATQQNFGRAMVRGLDFSTNVDALTRLGRFEVGFLATHLDRRDKEPFDGGAVLHDAGSLDLSDQHVYPRWRALGHVEWQRGAWQAAYAFQYIGSFVEVTSPLFEDTALRHSISAVTYHDVEVGYESPSAVRLRLGVGNVTDKDPPFIDNNVGPNTDAATYRLLGRTYFVDVRWQMR